MQLTEILIIVCQPVLIKPERCDLKEGNDGCRKEYSRRLI